MSGPVELKGPDLTAGVPLASLPDGEMFLGHAEGEAVMVVRRGPTLRAIGATCTHYGAPLTDGILVGDTVHCPWHHACFDLSTGAAAAPAFKPVPSWNVEQRGDEIFVVGKRDVPPCDKVAGGPQRIVVVGGGAAGHAAVETLRKEGYDGALTLVGADPSAPYDRPNVSKDYLAGNAPEEWMPMRPAEHYAEARVELRLGRTVIRIDVAARKVELDDGASLAYDALLLATGADPVHLTIPGHDLPHVHTLRSLADARAIIERSKSAKRAVVLGASFIGLEAAASLRARGLDVHVAAPDRPLERVLGPEVGTFVRKLHEEHGVVFHIGATAQQIDASAVMLSNGTKLPADLVLVGIGVRPVLALAQQAGCKIDRGVSVSAELETSVPGIWAAGDIARWPASGGIRVEHWVVAQRQGQTAARNMLGRHERYDVVPFFWSQHYDVGINYVGHAERWESIEIVGSLRDREALIAFRDGGRISAVATIGRDRASLAAEQALARDDQATLEMLVSSAR